MPQSELVEVRKVRVQVNGIEATPVMWKRFIQIAQSGEKIYRLSVVQIEQRFYVWMMKTEDSAPVTIELFRGGVRSWTSLDSLISWLQKELPSFHIEEIILRQ